jgi:uncharacterized Zn-binding protein involved in type VI secretion
MKRPLICLGDRTSHGGVVLEGNGHVRIGGKPAAALGDNTYCPLCKGDYPIGEALLHSSIGGRGTVVEGMRTACGASLIASQRFAQADDVCPRIERSGEVHQNDAAVYFERFRVIDEVTGAARADLAYRIERADGAMLRGVTDADGFTERVVSDGAMPLKLYYDAAAPLP